nr:MAG TPA: Bacterial PH domain protein [Caudoviricetes sp.]
MEDYVSQMCSNLFDKNGNKIDVNIVAAVYLSAFEIAAYFKKCTNYSGADIKLVSKYIDKLPGYDYSRKEISYYKRKIESCDWDFSTPTKKKVSSKSSKEKITLLPGEKVLDTLKFSCVPLISFCILFLLSFYIVSLAEIENARIFVIWLFAVLILYEICRLTMNHVILTNKRIIIRICVPKKSADDVPINKINGVSVKSWNEYKYGSLQIDTSSDCFLFASVKSPGTFRDSAISAMEQNKSEAMRQQAEEIAKAMKNN